MMMGSPLDDGKKDYLLLKQALGGRIERLLS